MSGTSNVLDAIAHPAQVNLLEAYQGAARTANSIWQNREWQAKQAAGEATQQATDANGLVDPVRAQGIIAQMGGRASLAAQGSATSNQALEQAQQNRSIQGQAHVNSTIAGLLSLPMEQQTPQAVRAGLDALMGARSISPQDEQAAISGLPPNATPQQVHQFLVQHAVTNLTAGDAASKVLPTQGPDITAPSGGLQGSQRAPLVGSPTPGAIMPRGGAVPQGTSPETRAGLVEVSDGQGNKYMVPRSSLPGASGSTQGTGSVGTGRPPASLRNPNAPPAADSPAADPAAAPAPPGVPPGATLSGVSPSTIEEQKGSTAHLLAARDKANNYQQTIQPIEGALAGLAGADTGKGGEVLNTIRAYAQDVAPSMLQRMLPNWATDKDARVQYEEANKYLTSMAINAPGGARSNAGQEAAGAATPSVHISNQAAQLVARAVLAQQRLQQAGTLAFNQSGQPAANYDRFMNTWNTNADPRAFIADKMTGPERAAMVKQMGGVGSPAYQRFKQSYQDATANGVVELHAGQ